MSRHLTIHAATCLLLAVMPLAAADAFKTLTFDDDAETSLVKVAELSGEDPRSLRRLGEPVTTEWSTAFMALDGFPSYEKAVEEQHLQELLGGSLADRWISITEYPLRGDRHRGWVFIARAPGRPELDGIQRIQTTWSDELYEAVVERVAERGELETSVESVERPYHVPGIVASWQRTTHRLETGGVVRRIVRSAEHRLQLDRDLLDELAEGDQLLEQAAGAVQLAAIRMTVENQVEMVAEGSSVEVLPYPLAVESFVVAFNAATEERRSAGVEQLSGSFRPPVLPDYNGTSVFEITTGVFFYSVEDTDRTAAIEAAGRELLDAIQEAGDRAQEERNTAAIDGL